MAVLTEIRTQNVISWLGCRSYTSTWRMAGSTSRGRSLKNTTDVAGLAVGAQMGAVEAKTGCEVIEIGSKCRLRARR